MNGTHFRTGLVIVSVALLAGVAGSVQRRRLSTLRGEIDQWRAKAAGEEATTEHAGRKRAREPRMDRAPADDDGLSLAGEETVPEALRLVALLAPGWRANPNKVWGQDWPQELEPLEDLMLGMGAGAGKKLMEDPALEEPERRLLREIFVRLNPQQSLLLSMSYPPGEARDREVSRGFGLWAHLDPVAALRWCRQMDAEHDPVAQMPLVAGEAMVAEAGEDPVRAVARMAELLETRPQDLNSQWVAAAVRRPGDVAGRIALMNALNAAEERFAEDPKRRVFWLEAVSDMNGALLSEPFDDAIAVVDGSYTPEQRREFAEKMSSGFEIGALEVPHWAAWLAALDLPADEKHPLLGMLNHANRLDPSGEPVWLDDLPKGELRDVAVAYYAKKMSYDKPEVAARWLVKMPAGEKRAAIARIVAQMLERKDEAVAEAFRKSEGMEK